MTDQPEHKIIQVDKESIKGVLLGRYDPKILPPPHLMALHYACLYKESQIGPELFRLGIAEVVGFYFQCIEEVGFDNVSEEVLKSIIALNASIGWKQRENCLDALQTSTLIP